MKALSLHAPWWWFILHARKDIENRDWRTNLRGRVYLHCAKHWDDGDVRLDIFDAINLAHPVLRTNLRPDTQEMWEARGCIVGSVEIVDCVTFSKSPWFFGRFGFVLANPLAFARPVPFKGARQFFEVPDDLISGDSNGRGIPAAVPADGMPEHNRPQAQAAEILLGRVPAERRPRDAQGCATQQAARAVRAMQGGAETQDRFGKMILE